jgi:LPXTG-motif cell wall-anchored protein
MRVFKAFLSAIVATAIVLVTFPAAATGFIWSTPVDVHLTGQDAFDPVVTVDSTGLVTAVWFQSDGSNFVIRSSTSQSGGVWSTPVTLSEPGGDALDPQLTVDSTGLVTAVWHRDNGTNTIIQSRTSQSGGAWSTPTVDLSAPGQSAAESQVTVSSAGLVTAVWTRSNGSNRIVQSRTSQSGGAWSTPTADLSAPGQTAAAPQVTVDSTGLVTAVWTRSNGSNTIIQSRTSQSGGAWSTPTVDLSATGANDPQVTVSSTGLVTAVWRRNDGSNDIIQSRTSQSGGAWSTPTADLSATGGGSFTPQLAVSSTGLVTAVWPRFNGSRFVIQSSTSQSGGAWSIPVNLSEPGGDALAPQLTVDSTGLVTAVWYRLNGIVTTIQSSTLGPRTTAPTTAAATTISPTLAATGANVEWLPVVGLLAVIAGSGFLAASRRR